MTTAQNKISEANTSIDRLVEIAERDNVHFLSVPNKFAIQNNDGSWVYVIAEAFYRQRLIHAPEEKRTFDVILNEMGRMKTQAVNTFRRHSADALNVLSRSSWLQPVAGDVDPIFDVLLNSLSGGRANVRDHLEKVFVYKYLHPECYTLPCITISGEGGAGKNEFIEKVMATVFTANQVEVIGVDEAFGNFNGRMLGKTVIFIDEAVTDKTDANSLKRKVGNKSIEINVKYGFQGSFDNTPWYWIGGNGTNGAVMLSGDTVDRRYSVLTVKTSLMNCVANHLGVEITWAPGHVLPDSHPCVKWYGANAWKLENQAEVAKWLNSVVEKWGDQPHPPSALHDEDYTTVRKAQKSVFEELMESVFHDQRFDCIRKSVLFEMFKLKTAQDSPATRAVKNKTAFEQDVNKWLASNGLDVAVRTLNVKPTFTHEKRTSSIFFTKPGVKSLVANNDGQYLHTAENGKVTLVDRSQPIADDETGLIEY